MSGAFSEQDRGTFERAIETWGVEAQAEMAEEECAEFIVASKHFARGKADREELIDEVADLRIMAEQMALFADRERVEQRVEQKMERLRERLDHATADGDDGANA